MLKEKGYRTELSVIVVKPEISYLSTKLRYEQMYSIGEDPRATPKENHDRVVYAIPDNLDEIYKTNKFDNITLYNRNQECLYSQKETPNLNPKEIIDKLGQVTSVVVQTFSMVGVVKLMNSDFSWYNLMLVIGMCVIVLRGPSVLRHMWYGTGSGKSLMAASKVAARKILIKA